MPEKKRRPVSGPPRLKIETKEILVARNRATEPYLHLFSVLPENVTQEPLGRLMGVFSTSDHTESSAYVGNVIASVARKEYFANTKRSAIESFESALHRSNIALSELVKHGDARFMGHLHGALAAIEHGTIHFSVTGEAHIVLFRDGTLTDIGDGLTSEDAVTHPMKTFVEISSGRLLPGDRIVLASPELFSLLPFDVLERNAGRLIPEGKFPDFLETAMRNELRTGVALVLEAVEAVESEYVPARRSGTKRNGKQEWEKNYFSDRTFRDAEQKRAEHILKTESPESETPKPPTATPHSGAIYVEGEAPPETTEHPFLTTIRWQYESLLHEIIVWSEKNGKALEKTLREASRSFAGLSISAFGSVVISLKRALGSLAGNAGDMAKRLIGQTKRLSDPATKTKRRQSDIAPASAHTDDNPILARALELTRRAGAESDFEEKSSGSETRRFGHRAATNRRYGAFVIPDRIRRTIWTAASRLEPYRRTVKRLLSRFARTTASGTSHLLRSAGSCFLTIPKRRQMLLVAGTAFLITLAGIGLWKASDRTDLETIPPVVVIEEPEPAFPPTDEPNAGLAVPETVLSGNGTVVTPVFLRNRLFIVTETGIFMPEDDRVFDIPADSPIVLAAGMDDLSLIFLLTGSGTIYSFAPSNGSFAKNEITVPNRFRPAGIGAFLTYLYLLDGTSGNIYRYPRAEGGFGEGTVWTVEPLASGTGPLAVNGAVYLADGSGIDSLFQGKPSGDFTFESPNETLTATAVCANEKVPNRFVVLDPPSRRFLLYDERGTMLAQYFNESFDGVTACALDDTGTHVAISSSESVLVVPLGR